MTRKLIFREKLYLGESIEEKKLDKLKKKLQSKPLLAGVHLIVPAHNPNDQLDIFEAKQLVQPHYKTEVFYVIGIAGSQKEAFSLIEQMVQECLRERGDCRLREFLFPAALNDKADITNEESDT